MARLFEAGQLTLLRIDLGFAGELHPPARHFHHAATTVVLRRHPLGGLHAGDGFAAVLICFGRGPIHAFCDDWQQMRSCDGKFQKL